jgi:hypothetical protein
MAANQGNFYRTKVFFSIAVMWARKEAGWCY